MLEKMNEFFNRRIGDYEEHQLTAIECATEFYPFTASLLPTKPGTRVLDLGCGTGLELGYYYKLNPDAEVTGIDVAEDFLQLLAEKFADKNPTLILGSYFTVPFGTECFDAAVSVESLHHFTAQEKAPLYKKLYEALIPGGYFILTDYLAPSEEWEKLHRSELLRLKAEQGISDDEFYHYDTPLTPEHELEILKNAGFSSIELLGHWENTYTYKCVKSSTIRG